MQLPKTYPLNNFKKLFFTRNFLNFTLKTQRVNLKLGGLLWVLKEKWFSLAKIQINSNLF